MPYLRPLLQSTCLTLGLFATPSLAQSALPENIDHFTLDNGLEVVVIEDADAPSVVQMLWYKIGSADEVPGRSGLAHYLEHLMFKGTDKLAAGELSKTVAVNGGMDNAFTSYDFTTYFQRIAADRLELVMEMEADRMANLRISPDDWQAERDVVREERRLRVESNPSALFAEERAATLYYNHPYGRPVIGWPDEVESLTREDAIDWYDSYYGPNNAVLVVAGGVTSDEVRHLTETYYGPIAARENIARLPRPTEPEHRSARWMKMSDPRVPSPQMVRVTLAPPRDASQQEEAATLTILAAILGRSPQTSVLAQALMINGDAIMATAYYDELAVDETNFTITMMPNPQTPIEEAEADLNAVLAKFAAEGPDPEHLERVKTQIRAEQIYARDSAHGLAYDYGQGLATGLSVEDVAEWPDLLGQVTAEQVQKAAQRLFDSPATVTGWLLPESTEPGRDAPEDLATE